jgi:PAS domain-containing protein
MKDRKRILIVDDNEEARNLLEMFLRSRGYEILTASNGKEALERLSQEAADLVLSDVLMPVMERIAGMLEEPEVVRAYTERFTSKLKREAFRWRNLFDAMLDMVALLGMDGKILQHNSLGKRKSLME